MTGPFMWEQHAQAKCTLWEPTRTGAVVSGLHNGYLRLTSPLVHERQLDLNSQQGTLKITDKIKSKGNHNIALYFHLSEYCSDIKIDGHRCFLTLGNNKVIVSLPNNLTIQSVRGEWNDDPEKPSLGWVSRNYHQRSPITTLIAKGNVTGNHQFNTMVSWS